MKWVAIVVWILFLAMVVNAYRPKPAPQGIAHLTCTPTVAFGNVPIGTSKTVVATCVNDGTVPILIQDVKVSGPGFGLGPDRPTNVNVLVANGGK